MGEYQFDIHKTIANFGSLGPYTKDSLQLEKFRIFFSEDSTFHMNMKVDFFTDTIGLWESGNCGFESPGQVRYPNSKSIEQFGQRQEGSSYFTKLSPYTKEYGTITLWFRLCDSLNK